MLYPIGSIVQHCIIIDDKPIYGIVIGHRGKTLNLVKWFRNYKTDVYSEEALTIVSRSE
jgi:hypothetical protein